MKKLISIGVALALLAMVIVPLGVAADYPTDPGAYSKTPFGILGSGIQLAADIVTDLATAIDGFGLPVSAAEISGVLSSVGDWTGINLAWLTDMTGWGMVAVGDVVTVITPLADTMGFGDYTAPIANVFYVLGGRIFDPWGSLLPGAGATLPDAGLGLPIVL